MPKDLTRTVLVTLSLKYSVAEPLCMNRTILLDPNPELGSGSRFNPLIHHVFFDLMKLLQSFILFIRNFLKIHLLWRLVTA
jgi:hypothetical protein